MNSIKVLGIGSPFGDDQAGWHVAESLKQQLALNSHINTLVHIESIDRPGIRLIELISACTTVFLIDAVKSGSPPGTIHQFTKEEIIHSEVPFSTHHMGILEALHIAEALNELPEHLFLYGIEIESVCFNALLSKPVALAVSALSNQLKSVILEKVESSRLNYS